MTTRIVLALAIVVAVVAVAIAGQKPDPPRGFTPIGASDFRRVSWHQRVFLMSDGKTVVGTGQDGRGIQFWDVDTGTPTHNIPLPGGNVHDAAYAPGDDTLAVITSFYPNNDPRQAQRLVWLVDATARKDVRTLPIPEVGHSVSYSVRITPDGKRVFAALASDIRGWDAATGKEILRRDTKTSLDAFDASPDGKVVAFGRNDLFLWHWEAGGEPKKITSVSGGGTELVRFSPDSKSLYVVPSSTPFLTRWDVATGKQTGRFMLGTLVWKMAFSPDGKTLALTHASYRRSLASDAAVDLIDPETGKQVGRLDGPRGEKVDHASWSKDGSRLVAATSYRAWVWDVKTGKVLGPTRPGHEGMIGDMTFAPDGTLYTASDDGTVRAWDTAGAMKRVWDQDYWVRGVAVSPDGSLVAGSALDNDLRIWDAATGKLRFKLLGNGSSGGRRQVRFSPDGKRLTAWGDDEYLRVWDLRNGKLIAENTTRTDPPADPDDPFGDHLRFLRRAFNASGLSHDGTTLALVSGTSLQLLDTMTGKERRKVAVGVSGVAQFAFSPDGKRLFLGGNGKQTETKLPDGRVEWTTAKEYAVWMVNLETGDQTWTAGAVGTQPRGLAYSPDGSKVAVVSNIEKQPATVRVWDAATGEDLGRIDLPKPGVCLAFDRPGKRLAVAFDDTTAGVYDLAAVLIPAGAK